MKMERTTPSVVFHEDVMDSPFFLGLFSLQSLVPVTHILAVLGAPSEGEWNFTMGREGRVNFRLFFSSNCRKWKFPLTPGTM